MILKSFEKLVCCAICGKPSSVLLIDSPISSLCKECYKNDYEIAIGDNQVVCYKIRIREIFDREKLLS